MSRSISYSSSFKISGSRTEDLAAVRCSRRRISTVPLNDGGTPLAEVIESVPKGESERGEDLLLGLGLPKGDWLWEARENMPLGVLAPV